MTINFVRNVAKCEGFCQIEEAEALLEWVLKKRKPKLDLSNLEHMHTAILQVVLASQIEVSAWPNDEKLASTFQNLLKYRHE